MAEKNGWDKYEIALLIDACGKVSRGTPKQEIVKLLSEQLRRRAIARQKKIDINTVVIVR